MWKIKTVVDESLKPEFELTNATAAGDHFYLFCNDVDAGYYKEVSLWRYYKNTGEWVLQNCYDREHGPVVSDNRGPSNMRILERWLAR